MPFLLFAALIGSSVGESLEISTADELIQFGNSVNSGSTYEGTTVLLSSDIDLTGKTFYPIGGVDVPGFLGVFDGQGYAIRNLKMSSTSDSTGLFGYSEGLTIRNVIIDSSCSITCSYSGSNDAFVGGIIGKCKTSNEHCNIENSVNMASVTFTGNTGEKSLYLGGIAGCIELSSSYNSTVKSCANYGDLKDSGESSDSYMGGIIGEPYGYSMDIKVIFYNSINYGTITYSGTTTNNLYIGGIMGYSYCIISEGCVSAGKISSAGTSSYEYTGSIIGYSYHGTYLGYCFITSELRSLSKYGYGEPSVDVTTICYDSTTFVLDETVYVTPALSATSLIDALNNFVIYNNIISKTDYSHWILNKDKKVATFTINDGRTTSIEMNYQIILTPSLARKGVATFTWYEDSSLTTPLELYEITADAVLYGKFSGPNFTVTLNVNGGDELAVKEMIVGYDSTYGELPEPTRTGYTFVGWFTEQTEGTKVQSGDKVISNDNHTLYAHWTIKKYTLTFVANGGTECSSIIQERNTPVTLPEPTRTGYTFDGWFSDSELTTQFTETTMPAEDKTLYAHWIVNQYTITFVVNGGTAVDPITENYNTSITLPEPNRTGYTFGGWYSDSELTTQYTETTMPAENKTLYAKWDAKKYTVTFEFGNGIGAETRTFSAGEAIDYPENPEREGFTFAGWSPKPEIMPAEDITIVAQWNATKPTDASERVEVVFSQDLTKGDAEEIIKGYVPEGTEFTVESCEERRVVVKFNNKEDAARFIEAIKASGSAKKIIISIDFISESFSFASSLGLSALAFFLAYFFSF